MTSNDPLAPQLPGSEARAEDAALAWFVRLRDEEVSEDDKATFRAWLGADPTNAQAYGEVVRLWGGLDGVSQRPSTLIHPVITHPPARRSALSRLAMAASLAAAFGLGAYALAPAGFLADHRTSAGEQRTVTLTDGSNMEINTASAISIAFDPEVRQVTLHGGEAYFEVAKDPTRPFVVDAGAGRIEVLGTAFSVRRFGDAVSVIVTESEVEVSGPDGRTAVVRAGQSLEVTESGGLGRTEPADAGKSLAWRRGRLVFDNRPLGEVLAELERYRTGRILIMDSALESLPVTGSFSIARPEDSLQTVERTLPLHLYRLSDLLILVFANS